MAKDKEIKHGDVHCMTSCGYQCKAQVRHDLMEHYGKLLVVMGAGWEIHDWHNCGWHACLYHTASGFYLRDRSVRGGIDHVRYNDNTEAGKRFDAYNHSGPEGTTQVWAYGDTGPEAWENVKHKITERLRAYRTLRDLMEDKGNG